MNPVVKSFIKWSVTSRDDPDTIMNVSFTVQLHSSYHLTVFETCIYISPEQGKSQQQTEGSVLLKGNFGIDGHNLAAAEIEPVTL